jgi:hypothetical protein
MAGDFGGDDLQNGAEIPLADTGIRILLTLLFAVVASVLRTVLIVIVVFELLWALITRRAPSVRLREFANRVVAYFYRLHRYVTYNEATVPFPFSPFPPAVEATGSPHEETDANVRDLLRSDDGS